VKPPIRGVVITGDVATCLGTVKDVSTLSRINVESGDVLSTHELPQLTFFRLATSGWGLGVRKSPRVGEGPSSLFFLQPDGAVHSSVDIPDSVSEVAGADGRWFVGSRIGQLYAFDAEGRLLWNWMVPGSDTYEGSPYFRPCPYFVAAAAGFVAVSSMQHLYAFRFDGTLLWAQEVPNKGPTVITMPLDDESGSDSTWKTLGLTRGATHDDVKRAYRALALDTHPDRNPDDPEAATRFREVQSAYEAVLNGTESRTLGVVTITMDMQALVAHMTAVGDTILVSSSDGVLTRIDGSGVVRSRRTLGGTQVMPALRDDGSLAATYCDGILSFFEGDSIVNAAAIEEYPSLFQMWGDDVVAARSASLHVFDERGRVAWDVDFTKRIAGLSVDADRLVCASGALITFQRSSGGPPS
jgi:curved DNA-binding protein CbpA